MRWGRDQINSPRCAGMTRRNWLAAVLGCGLPLAAFGRQPVQAQDGALVQGLWPSRTLETTPEVGEHRAPVVTALAVRPNEPMFVTGGDDHHIYLWDTHEGCVLDRLEGHRDWILTLAFAPRGDLLASAGSDRRVIFWNMDERRPVHQLADARHAITHLRWSHDGRWIAGIGFEDCLRIYDFEARQVARVLKCPAHDMRAIAVSPDDRLIAAAGRSGVVRFWQLPEGTHLLDIRPHHRRIRTLNFSPDGAYVVSAGEDRWIHIHPVAGDEEGFDLATPPMKSLSAVFYGPHHLAIGGSDNQIHLWDLAAGKRIGALTGHTGSVAALDATTSLLLSGSFDTTVRMWSIVPNLAKKPIISTGETLRR